MNGPVSAAVEVLAAEVRVVMVGNRQITQSVYKQLDWARSSEIEPWGRVRGGTVPKDRYGTEREGVELIGRRLTTGELVRSFGYEPDKYPLILLEAPVPFSDWFLVGPSKHSVAYEDWSNWERLPSGQSRITVLERGDLTVYVDIPSNPRNYADLSVPPGEVRYASEQVKAEILEEAQAEIDAVLEARDRYQRLVDLPLIVLAGLR